LLEINGAIHGGQLQVAWTYSRNIHVCSTIERVAGEYLDALEALIAYGRSPQARACTPGDFPMADLSGEELADLIARADDSGETAP
jgi:non-ribosomal peptide synthase protein (TIGR01720 family)